MYPPNTLTRRRHGYGSLIIAVVTAIMVALAALSVTHVNQTAYSGLTSSKLALQAQEYALAKAEFVRAVNYDELTAQSRSLINNSVNFYDEVIVGTEEEYPEDSSIKQKVCTVNVYRDAEVLPRYSLRVTRLSASQSGAGVPAGSILSWYGQLADLPDGFALCDGTNGTPDLRDRFIVGAGSTYALSAVGGANEVTLDATQIGSHYHFTGWHNNNNTGRFPTTAGTLYTPEFPTGYSIAKWNGSGGGGYSGYTCSGWNMITSLAVATAAKEAHENRPPYYALYYIMKL